MIRNPLFVWIVLAVLACTDTEQNNVGVAPNENYTPSNRIDIPPTIRRNLGITFAGVELRHVARTIRVPGAFELKPRARHEYRMSLPGRVEILVEQYERVEAGRSLFRFQSPAWPELVHEIIVSDHKIDSALAQIEVAKAKMKEAEQKLALIQDRLDALAGADFKKADLEAQAGELAASLPRLKAELELAHTELSNAKRIRQHALHRAETVSGIPESQLVEEVVIGDNRMSTYMTLQWIEVKAEHPGVIEQFAVTDGAYVEAPDAVLSIVDPEQVRFRALALQADLAKLSAATEARIVPPRTPGIALGEAVDATFTLGLKAHPNERTMTLLATPKTDALWIRSGVSAFLEVVVDSTGSPALAIPRSSIVKDGITHVFFRRDPADPNKAIRVEADLGVSDGRWIEIQSGLSRDDEVVLDGAYELKLASQQSGMAQDGGHFHADGSLHEEH